MLVGGYTEAADLPSGLFHPYPLYVVQCIYPGLSVVSDIASSNKHSLVWEVVMPHDITQ